MPTTTTAGSNLAKYLANELVKKQTAEDTGHRSPSAGVSGMGGRNTTPAQHAQTTGYINGAYGVVAPSASSVEVPPQMAQPAQGTGYTSSYLKDYAPTTGYSSSYLKDATPAQTTPAQTQPAQTATAPVMQTAPASTVPDTRKDYLNGGQMPATVPDASKQAAWDEAVSKAKQTVNNTAMYANADWQAEQARLAQQNAQTAETAETVQTVVNPTAKTVVPTQSTIQTAVQNAEQTPAQKTAQELQDEYNAQLRAQIEDSYRKQLEAAQRNYDYQVGQLQSQADKAKADASQAYKLGQRNLDQRLAAGGLTGGASESSIAAAYNNYINNRNDIDMQLADANAELANNYQNVLADLYSQYQKNLSDADLSDYQFNLQQLQNNANIVSPTQKYKAVNAEEVNPAPLSLSSRIKSLMNSGATESDILNSLYSDDELRTAYGDDFVNAVSNALNSERNDRLSYRVKAMLNSGMTTDDIIQSLYNDSSVRGMFASDNAFADALANMLNGLDTAPAPTQQRRPDIPGLMSALNNVPAQYRQQVANNYLRNF